MRDKRIMTLAAVTAVGQQDLAEIQVNAALLNGELDEAELKEMAVFLTHYLGFPLGSALNGAVDKVVAKRKKAAEQGRGRGQEGQRQRRREDALRQDPRRRLTFRTDSRTVCPTVGGVIRVIQWATGSVGRHAVRAVHAHPDLELVGAYVYSADKAGRDVGDICDIGPIGVTATGDRDAILASGRGLRPLHAPGRDEPDGCPR